MSDLSKNNFPNPLDHYNSYSYHFVLTVGSTTEAFRNMVGGSGILDKISGVDLGASFQAGNDTAYLLIDTRRFSQFSITHYETVHAFSGNPKNPLIPIGDGNQMELIDTTGFGFFDLLLDILQNKMQTSSGSAFFLLSILFVGHRDDGTTTTISSSHTPLMLNTMGITFDHRGGIYSINWQEIAGANAAGSAGGASIDFLGDVLAINTEGRPGTIGGLIGDLEARLNKNALDFYVKYSNVGVSATGSNSKFGKLVQYMITVPQDKSTNNNWADFKITNAGRSMNDEQRFTVSGGKDTSAPPSAQAVTGHVGKNWHLSFSQNTTISDAIKLILETSSDYLKLMSQDNRRAGKAKACKIITSITSDATSHVIHFDVLPYYLEKEVPPEDKQPNTIKAGVSAQVVGDSTANIKNLITYDYLYTGNNSHIKDLKISFDPVAARVALDKNPGIGQHRHASVAAAGQKQNKVHAVSQDSAKAVDFNPMIRPNDPIFLPIKSKDQQQNNTSQKNEELPTEQARDSFKQKQEYIQTLAMANFVASTQLDLQVRGNPALFVKYANREDRGGFPPHNPIISAADLNLLRGSDTAQLQQVAAAVSKSVNSAKQYYIEQYINPQLKKLASAQAEVNNLTSGPDVSMYPLFVKINMRAPNVDWQGNFRASTNKFVNDKFFNGPYMVSQMVTKFDGGDFSHDFTLIPYSNLDGQDSDNTNSAIPSQPSKVV